MSQLGRKQTRCCGQRARERSALRNDRSGTKPSQPGNAAPDRHGLRPRSSAPTTEPVHGGVGDRKIAGLSAPFLLTDGSVRTRDEKASINPPAAHASSERVISLSPAQQSWRLFQDAGRGFVTPAPPPLRRSWWDPHICTRVALFPFPRNTLERLVGGAQTGLTKIRPFGNACLSLGPKPLSKEVMKVPSQLCASTC